MGLYKPAGVAGMKSVYQTAITPNYIVDTTSLGAGNDKWTSTTVQTYTVPAGKVWLLWGGQVTTDAAETLVVTMTDGTNTLLTLASYGAAAAEQPYPETANMGNYVMPLIMPAGYTVLITCGGAQGATAAATCVVTEIDA